MYTCELAVTQFASFSCSLMDVNTATTALEVAHMHPSKPLGVTTYIDVYTGVNFKPSLGRDSKW